MAKVIDFVTSTGITNDDYLVMAENSTGNTRKIKKSDATPIINDLATGGTDKYLSAEQGKVAKGLIDINTTDINTLKGQVLQKTLTNIEIGSSPITSLTGILDGFVDSLIFKGKTRYKTSGGIYTDTYATGVILESAGQNEGKITMSSLKPDNTIGDSINITLATPLRGITVNATKYQDILNVTNKTVIRNIGKKIFTGTSTETWTLGNPTLQTNTLQFIYTIGDCKTGLSSTEVNLMNDKFAMISSTDNIANDSESIAINENGKLLIRILKSKLSSQDVAGFKLWLNSVNVTIVYPLVNSISETINDVGTLQTFADGYLQLDNVIVPIVNFNYPVKLASVVDEHTKIIDSTVDKIGDLTTGLSDLTKIPGVIDDTGSANIYVITLVSAPTAYAKYQTFKFIAKTANTGASTLNVNGLGVKALVKDVNVALVTGDILVGQIITAIYDGTNFQIVPDFSAKFASKVDVSYENPIVPTLIGSWVNYGGANNTAGYWKDPLGNIHLKGTIKNGVVNNAAFQLPVGYRPILTEMFAVPSGGGLFGIIQITNDGYVTPMIGSNAYFYLDGINFKAGV